MKKLNVAAIRIDGGTQARVSLNEATVAEYAECLEDLPPVVVFFDGSDNWLADGFHRLHAYRKAGKASIPADIRTGTQRDAILFSLGANRAHGLRVTNADKRKAVAAMLADAEWSQWSDRKIAEACGVGHTLVAALRDPEVAQKQSEHRVASAAKKAAEVESDSTRAPKKEAAGVITVITPEPKKEAPKGAPQPQAQERTPEVQEPAGAEELAEAHHTITELAQENERLQDRLAVEAMDASEYEKTQASDTIRDLRERVRLLEIEVAALKSSRDTYMRESSEKSAQINYWRKEAKKAVAVA